VETTKKKMCNVYLKKGEFIPVQKLITPLIGFRTIRVCFVLVLMSPQNNKRAALVGKHNYTAYENLIQTAALFARNTEQETSAVQI